MIYLACVIILSIVSSTKGMSSGPPMCTLDPLHSGAPPATTDWRNLFEISMTQINQNLLADHRNATGMVDYKTNGWFVVIEPKEDLDKPELIKIKGFALKVMTDDIVEFPHIHRNKRLKKLDCYNGEIMLSHRDASEKKRVSFFFLGYPDYLTSKKTMFQATIVSSYMKYWSEIKF
uniref:Reelin domain-containing protein n=1 Tax=Acartia pacifica TaxID=335913 RepID=A0A0U2UNR1_ACAPC|nr:hypothetical protein [Acartia pacifica]